MLRLKDKWLWDFWFAQDGPDTHIFYLQADRSLGDERLRHWNVSIGHAVSQDLHRWQILPDALRPSSASNNAVEPFDSYTTWTGSVIGHDGTWYMFYTGSRRSENGLIQRIGLATSTDLITWHKHGPQPLVEADPTYYELLDRKLWHDQAWRDPWVMRDEAGNFHMLITARANYGPADARGVVGHAVSRNLIDWEVRPPLTKPGEFGHMEVPQVVALNGRYYLLFSCPHDMLAQAHIKRLNKAQDGTHYMVADTPLGPYRTLTDDFLTADARFYSGKIIKDSQSKPFYFAFSNYDAKGNFIGTLSDPYPIEIDAMGSLKVLFDA